MSRGLNKVQIIGHLGKDPGKQYLVKGQQVYIEGRLQTRRWDDKEGQKHTSVEIVANEMMMLGDRRDSTINQNQEMEASSPDNSTVAEDEFPF